MLLVEAGKQELCDVSFLFQVANPEDCDQMYESLVRIHTNYHKNKVSTWRGSLSVCVSCQV